MAHNIEIRNGVASFAENGKKERAWHGLGDDQQIFDRPCSYTRHLRLAMPTTLSRHSQSQLSLLR